MTAEQRRHRRCRTSLPVDVRFLAEEETFTPFQYNACVANLSVAGALVTIPDLGSEQYAVLFRRPRFLRLACYFPSNERPLLLFGRVVWHEYCPGTRPALCRTAVVFEPLDDVTLQRLAAYLEQQADSAEIAR